MIDTKPTESISKADIAAAIIASTQEVFSTMLSMEVASQEITLPQTIAATPTSGIISLIGLTGPWAGTGSLSCNAEFACTLSSKMLMGACHEVNEEVLDAIAEITNMIIGNVKTVLEQKVGDMDLSTPTVIFGLNFQTRSAQANEWTGVRFTSGGQEMCVLVCLAPATPRSHRTGFQFPQMLSA
jgi:chemotaxis protein CheX